MPDTKPTPTVIAQALTATDIALARKWFRCGCGRTYETIMESGRPDGDHHHVADEVERMAAEIAAAREAWGVSREAVAGLGCWHVIVAIGGHVWMRRISAS